MGTLSVHQESVVCVDARYYRMTCYFMLFYNGNSFCSQVAAVVVLVPDITGCHAALRSSVMGTLSVPRWQQWICWYQVLGSSLAEVSERMTIAFLQIAYMSWGWRNSSDGEMACGSGFTEKTLIPLLCLMNSRMGYC